MIIIMTKPSLYMLSGDFSNKSQLWQTDHTPIDAVLFRLGAIKGFLLSLYYFFDEWWSSVCSLGKWIKISFEYVSSWEQCMIC